MNNDKTLQEQSKKENLTNNSSGKQAIKTSETKLVKTENGNKSKEVLIGKDIEEVKQIEENFTSLEKRILDKLT